MYGFSTSLLAIFPTGVEKSPRCKNYHSLRLKGHFILAFSVDMLFLGSAPPAAACSITQLWSSTAALNFFVLFRCHRRRGALPGNIKKMLWGSASPAAAYSITQLWSSASALDLFVCYLMHLHLAYFAPTSFVLSSMALFPWNWPGETSADLLSALSAHR